MKIKVVDTYDEISDEAAELVLAQLREKPDCVLGLTAGSSPMGLYERLQAAYQEGRADFSRVRIFTLSEYIGLDEQDEQSFAYYTRKNFCDGLNLSEQNIRMPNGMADDIALECARYGEAIAAAGGIDLMILGIGPNAHIGFNEPGSCFVPETHVVELSNATRAANARFFDVPDDVPHWAVSMGMRDIMFAQKILLLASGPGKTEALKMAVAGDITPKAPASLLQLHRGAIVIADQAAASRLPGYDGCPS
ncbi:MAG: glucosamine-6-phosphate deaminase [Schwartzia sp.]|nr:glucosamine-6-phosphate deaminase [Schwartzia sp. (in: firmicutes)]MBR1760039.1 glucosamine-6-phosphate deaminase [Schwartzia sp. (in: firmicutes)]MBR1885640.1 glucosamine-6-phosphate deaminase [Schwartzia sp. (in: firmicutes)]